MGKLLKGFTAIIIILTSFFSFFLFAQTHRIVVVYNNLPYKKGLITDWGISCVIEGYTYKILFDTGSDGSILLQNLKKLGTVVLLDASFEWIHNRLKKAKNSKQKLAKRPLFSEEKKAKALYREREKAYKKVADVVVDVEKYPLEEQLAYIAQKCEVD